MPAFAIWDFDAHYTKKYAFLMGMGGKVSDRRLREATPLLPQWGDDQFIIVGRAFDALADNLKAQPLVVSTRLRAWLEVHGGPGLEFLPVQLTDGKKKVYSAGEYSVVHVMNEVDCLDLEASAAELDDEEVDEFKRLILRPEAVPPGVMMFRVRRLPGVVFVREALVNAFIATDFSGVMFLDPSTYDGMSKFPFFKASARPRPPARKASPAAARVDGAAAAEKLLGSLVGERRALGRAAAAAFDHEPAELAIRFYPAKELKGLLLESHADELEQLGVAEDGEWTAPGTVPLAAVGAPGAREKSGAAFHGAAFGWVFFDAETKGLFVTTSDHWERDRTFASLAALGLKAPPPGR